VACKTETTEIDGLNVVVTQWPVERALLMKMRFGRIVGPALAPLAQAAKGSGKTDLESLITEAIGAVFASSTATPEEITGFIKDCFTKGGVHINGESLNNATYTTLFSGDGMGTMYKVLAFIVKTNYGDLMPGQREKAAAVTDQNSAPTNTPMS